MTKLPPTPSLGQELSIRRPLPPPPSPLLPPVVTDLTGASDYGGRPTAASEVIVHRTSDFGNFMEAVGMSVVVSCNDGDTGGGSGGSGGGDGGGEEAYQEGVGLGVVMVGSRPVEFVPMTVAVEVEAVPPMVELQSGAKARGLLLPPLGAPSPRAALLPVQFQLAASGPGSQAGLELGSSVGMPCSRGGLGAVGGGELAGTLLSTAEEAKVVARGNGESESLPADALPADAADATSVNGDGIGDDGGGSGSSSVVRLFCLNYGEMLQRFPQMYRQLCKVQGHLEQQHHHQHDSGPRGQQPGLQRLRKVLFERKSQGQLRQPPRNKEVNGRHVVSRTSVNPSVISLHLRDVGIEPNTPIRCTSSNAFPGFISFGALFEVLVEKYDMLPLALYRRDDGSGGRPASRLPYVCTKPEKFGTFLRGDDDIYLLAAEDVVMGFW